MNQEFDSEADFRNASFHEEAHSGIQAAAIKRDNGTSLSGRRLGKALVDELYGPRSLHDQERDFNLSKAEGHKQDAIEKASLLRALVFEQFPEGSFDKDGKLDFSGLPTISNNRELQKVLRQASNAVFSKITGFAPKEGRSWELGFSGFMRFMRTKHDLIWDLPQGRHYIKDRAVEYAHSFFPKVRMMASLLRGDAICRSASRKLRERESIFALCDASPKLRLGKLDPYQLVSISIFAEGFYAVELADRAVLVAAGNRWDFDGLGDDLESWLEVFAFSKYQFMGSLWSQEWVDDQLVISMDKTRGMYPRLVMTVGFGSDFGVSAGEEGCDQSAYGMTSLLNGDTWPTILGILFENRASKGFRIVLKRGQKKGVATPASGRGKGKAKNKTRYGKKNKVKG